MPQDDEWNIEDIPEPEFINIEMEAFEDEWREWLENPPVDWAPPRGATRILTSTLDMRKEGQFIMRFDAWQGEAGIHVHGRVVMLTVVPATLMTVAYVRRRKPWWALWKKREFHLYDTRESVIDRRIVSKNIVGSFVIPWGVWSAMESDRLDPAFPKKPNGKGGDPDTDFPWRAKDVLS